MTTGQQTWCGDLFRTAIAMELRTWPAEFDDFSGQFSLDMPCASGKPACGNCPHRQQGGSCARRHAAAERMSLESAN